MIQIKNGLSGVSFIFISLCICIMWACMVIFIFEQEQRYINNLNIMNQCSVSKSNIPIKSRYKRETEADTNWINEATNSINLELIYTQNKISAYKRLILQYNADILRDMATLKYCTLEGKLVSSSVANEFEGKYQMLTADDMEELGLSGMEENDRKLEETLRIFRRTFTTNANIRATRQIMGRYTGDPYACYMSVCAQERVPFETEDDLINHYNIFHEHDIITNGSNSIISYIARGDEMGMLILYDNKLFVGRCIFMEETNEVYAVVQIVGPGIDSALEKQYEYHFEPFTTDGQGLFHGIAAVGFTMIVTQKLLKDYTEDYDELDFQFTVTPL